MEALQCDEAAPSQNNATKTDRCMVDSETVHRDNKIQTRFRLIDKIGEGTYGIVFKAEDRENPHEGPVALKKIWLDERGEGVPVTTLREVALLKELNHVNIVRMRDFIAMTPRLFLVFDFLDQDLKQCLDSHFLHGTPPLFVKWCMVQILRGLEFCHGKRVIHRDLKPQNVLIDHSGNVKLADFGLARSCQLQCKQCYTHEVVTLWYRAPELLLGVQQYSASVDLWSAGCIFAEVCCRKPLFPGDSEIDELFKIFRGLGTPNDTVWPGVSKLPDFQPTFPMWKPTSITSSVPRMEALAADLLRQLVVYNPDTRLRADEALSHPYFEDIRGQLTPPTLASCGARRCGALTPSTSSSSSSAVLAPVGGLDLLPPPAAATAAGVDAVSCSSATASTSSCSSAPFVVAAPKRGRPSE